jgi:hypothetical protein
VRFVSRHFWVWLLIIVQDQNLSSLIRFSFSRMYTYTLAWLTSLDAGESINNVSSKGSSVANKLHHDLNRGAFVP